MSDHVRGPASTDWNTGHLVQKLRNEKPLCRVCGTQCDPDAAPVALLLIQLDAVRDLQGLIPVHCDGHGPGGRRCEQEARARMAEGQKVIDSKRMLDQN